MFSTTQGSRQRLGEGKEDGAVTATEEQESFTSLLLWAGVEGMSQLSKCPRHTPNQPSRPASSSPWAGPTLRAAAFLPVTGEAPPSPKDTPPQEQGPPPQLQHLSPAEEALSQERRNWATPSSPRTRRAVFNNNSLNSQTAFCSSKIQ